jgi:hypothetical protein
MNTTSHITLPTPLATALDELLDILDGWLVSAADTIHEDLTRFASTELDYPGHRWDLLEDLGRHSLALHRHLTQTKGIHLP